MSKRIALTLFVVLVLSLSACTRAASTPLPTATLPPNFPAAVSTSNNMGVIEAAGTQTAIAQTGTPQGGQPQLPTNTPIIDPNATQAPVVAATATPGVPATALPAPTTIPAGSKPTSYALHAGEFPYCIARRFNVDPDELLALSGLSKSQSNFDPGTLLKIPQTGKAFPGARALRAHPATYTVLSGDTIYSIACKFGDVEPTAIASANNLSASYTLTVGSQINIP
jgi:LysM repeat protein